MGLDNKGSPMGRGGGGEGKKRLPSLGNDVLKEEM